MRKLAMEVDYRKVPAMCCWSDLLGFGHDVSKNNWNPTDEQKKGFPGARTVVAGGERLLHNWDKFTSADLLYRFEGREKGKGSAYYEHDKHIIMENPLPLQMNTAFSKAYILDDGGGKKGLPGSNFYIEQNTLDLIKHYSEIYHDHCSSYIWNENDDNILFTIPKKGNEELFHLGFELSKPIAFDYKGLATVVYRLNKFYPWDEDPKEFSILLDEPNIFFAPVEAFKGFFSGSNSVLTYPQGSKHMGYEVEFIEVDSIDDIEE